MNFFGRSQCIKGGKHDFEPFESREPHNKRDAGGHLVFPLKMYDLVERGKRCKKCQAKSDVARSEEPHDKAWFDRQERSARRMSLETAHT